MADGTKHTPGPWKLVPRHGGKPGQYRHIIEPRPGQELGSKSIVLSMRAEGDVEDWWLTASPADAALIAAAPDLLEALQGILDDDDSGVSLADQRSRWVERMNTARAAIARATTPAEGK